MKAGKFLALLCAAACLVLALPKPAAQAADHNDPNSINSIFFDLPPSPADLYDFFGWPSDGPGAERVILALTFAGVPAAGKLDPDLLYRVLISPGPRTAPNLEDDASLDVVLKYLSSVTDNYVQLHPGEARVTVDEAGKATVTLRGFPGGDFTQIIESNRTTDLHAPDGSVIKAYIGGRDDAFFNDLPGFFRSINYAPQFYQIEHTRPLEMRELPIPKTLLELQDNQLFNFDPKRPDFGADPRTKIPLPSEHTLAPGKKYQKDAKGNYRFAYSGRDAQAGKNVNAIILEIPMRYLTTSAATDRVISAWGESWVRKASAKVDTIPDNRPPMPGPFWFRHPWVLPLLASALALAALYFGLRKLRGTWSTRRLPHAGWKLAAAGALAALGLLLGIASLYVGKLLTRVARLKPSLTLTSAEMDNQLRQYKIVDTDGLPFADAALNLREDNRQLGGYNLWLGPHFLLRLAHLGWGFGPSVDALGLKSSFDSSGSPVSVHKEYSYAELLDAFQRGRKVVFQKLNMPDESWNKHHLPIPLRRPIEIFIPNACAIDMDTSGTWPFGRRPEDQVATRFLSLFLDMTSQAGGKPVNVETLGDPATWQTAPIEPKTPPNPLQNDKPFLKEFPYLAEPWPEHSPPHEAKP